MDTAKEPTIEELQSQVLELQKQNEQLRTEKEAGEKSLNETKSALDSARKINSELWIKQKGGTSPILNADNTDEPEELTPEKALDGLLDDALTVNLTRMHKIYGDSVNTKIVKERLNGRHYYRYSL